MSRSYDAEMTHNDLSAERSDRGVQEWLAQDQPAAADYHVSAAGGKPSRPASMFSALGHCDTIWSDVKGDLALSRQIAWDGCTAATHKIITASGGAEIRSRSLELHFSWNSGYVEADAESARQVRAYRNRPRYGFILPPDATAEFRIKEKSNYQFLTIELDLGYVLRSLEVQDLPGVEVIETWEYDDPLSWHIAEAIRADCEHDAPQGLLYSETATTLLALQVIRGLSNRGDAVKVHRRGGLSPAVLRRACEYMVSRICEDIALREVASVCSLSPGHFAVAFKQSTGVAPHAWLRRQRIDRARALLRDQDLSLTCVARSVGFATQSAFGVAFKKETGSTPAMWRRLHQS